MAPTAYTSTFPILTLEVGRESMRGGVSGTGGDRSFGGGVERETGRDSVGVGSLGRDHAESTSSLTGEAFF